MEVSPAASSNSTSPIRDELKESLRSENFFLNKMDPINKSPKTEASQTKPDSSNIRIEIGGEKQSSTQDSTQQQLIGAVSPLSGASSDFGIQRGAVSLESSTSGEQRERLSQAITEANEHQDSLE